MVTFLIKANLERNLDNFGKKNVTSNSGSTLVKDLKLTSKFPFERCGVKMFVTLGYSNHVLCLGGYLK